MFVISYFPILSLISKIIVTIQNKNEAKPMTKQVKVSLFMTPKLSGPPRHIIYKNKLAHETISIRKIRSVKN